MQTRSNPLQAHLLRQISQSTGAAPIQLVLGNERFCPPNVNPVATVTIRDPQTLAGLIVDPEVAFGEAYSDGRIRVEGDLVGFLEAVYRSMANAPAARSWYSRLASKSMQLLQPNSPGGSRHNIHRHYDLGNEFYKLWLDRALVYTCAYFPSPFATLEAAQSAKMDY